MMRSIFCASPAVKDKRKLMLFSNCDRTRRVSDPKAAAVEACLAYMLAHCDMCATADAELHCLLDVMHPPDVCIWCSIVAVQHCSMGADTLVHSHQKRVCVRLAHSQVQLPLLLRKP